MRSHIAVQVCASVLWFNTNRGAVYSFFFASNTDADGSVSHCCRPHCAVGQRCWRLTHFLPPFHFDNLKQGEILQRPPGTLLPRTPPASGKIQFHLVASHPTSFRNEKLGVSVLFFFLPSPLAVLLLRVFHTNYTRET